MSELKVYRFLGQDEVWPDANLGRAYYLKSEADKVIAELEESHKREVEQLLIEIVELKKQVHDYAQGLYVIKARAEKEARHSNYKRCLAMASTCRLRARWFGDNAFYKKEQWALQWHKRWLELAQKFKEAK